jgi:hypothetical protein
VTSRASDSEPNPGTQTRSLTIVDRTAAIAAVLLAISWGLASLWFPPGRDQGVFLWIGDVALNGGAPYRDAWETKGPTVFVISLLIRGLFGSAVWGIRLFDALVAIATFAGCASMLRYAGANRGIPFAALTCVVSWTGLGWWHTSQPDGWAAACMTGSLLLAFRARGSLAYSVLALSGALAGAAALIKPFYALFALVVAVPIAGRERRLTSAAAWLIGVSVPLLALGVWFYALGPGTLRSFIEIHLRFNASVYASAATPDGLLVQRASAFVQTLAGLPLLPSLALALAAPFLVWRDHSKTSRTQASEKIVVLALLTWLAIGAFWILLQGKFWGYQWIPLFPPTATLAGLGAARLWRSGSERHPVNLMMVAIVLALLAAAIPAARQAAGWLSDVVIERDKSAWQSRFGNYYDLASGDFVRVANHLDATLDRESRVLVWGMEPIIYALADRRAATSFGVNLPLVLGPDSPQKRRAHSKFLTELRRSPPARIVILTDDRNQLLPRNSDELIDEVPGFREYLASAYEEDTTIASARILRPRSSATISDNIQKAPKERPHR